MYGKATTFYTSRMCPQKSVEGFTLISVGFETGPLICSLIMVLGGQNWKLQACKSEYYFKYLPLF